MDELDKKLYKLYHHISSDIEVPDKCETIIKEALSNKKTNKKARQTILLKMLSTACASILLVTGIVYAGVIISNNIWKHPEKIVGFYSEKNENTITEEQKANAISEDEAMEKGKQLLKKFGYSNEKIELLELEANGSNYALTWHIKTKKGVSLRFDAKNEDRLSIFDDKILDGNISNYRTTEEVAKETAKNFCKKYGYDITPYNVIKVRSNMNTEEESYIWYVYFYKEYDGIINPYESINIGFIPEINKLYYFAVSNYKYENNPVKVTREQAIETAKEKEQKIRTVYKIGNIDANLDIVQMNGDAYFRITNYEEYRKQYLDCPDEEYVEYRVDNVVRKIWAVTIQYDIPDDEDRFAESFNPFDQYYTYYIDATTGEMIGGSATYYQTNQSL